MRFISPLLVLLALCTFAVPTMAQAPDSLSFQGFLTDDLGNPLDSTNVSMTFNLYKGGSSVWTETQSVDVSKGVFNVHLGAVVPLDTVAFNQPIDLGIKLDGEASEITPRTRLAASAFALGIRGLYAIEAVDGTSSAPNLIGGAANNSVPDGVWGATIGGGGGVDFGTPRPNTVTAKWGTVGGGRDNTASTQGATVGGGTGNTASGSAYSTVGGGSANTASNQQATVGGGAANTASAVGATVAGGARNTASGPLATIPGGEENSARGYASFAAGHDAKAIHDGTFVWNDRSITFGNDSLLSTGPNQFLIRAAGGVGIGTNSPDEQLHILEAGGSTGLKLGGGGSAGPHGIVFEDDAAGDGVSLFWRTASDRLVLERGSQGTGTDDTDAFFYDRPSQTFRFAGAISASASFSNHLVGIDNTSTGTGADVLALRVGRSTFPETTNAFITFKYNGNDSAGFINGNGAGGVNYTSSGNDYAELLPHLSAAETLEPGDVVGVFDGKVSHLTLGADKIMAVSTAPVVVGNHTLEESETGHSRIAFIGQAPIRVVGPVETGDFLIPSGSQDGTAVAVAPERIAPDQLRSVFATAWEANPDPGIKKVNAVIGVDQVGAAVEVIESLQTQIDELRALVLKLQTQ